METVQNIHNRILNEVKNDYDKSPGAFIYDATKPAAIEFERFYKSLEDAKAKLSLENLKGDELAQRIYELTGIKRKEATKATDFVEIKGQPGSIIRVGDKVAANNVFYSSLEEKAIDATGTLLIKVECDQYGTVGNVPANAINYFPVTLSGIISVTNTNPFTNGYEAETDESLLQRYYERIRTPATSNNKYHFRNWAKEVTGVGDVRIFPLWDGPNTVKVVIINSNMQPASQDLVDEVQEYIDPNGAGLGEGKSSFGSFCTVVSANPLNIDISVSITLADGYNNEVVEQNISSNIVEYLKKKAFKQNFVSYAQIGSVILESEGVLDYSDLKVNDDIVNIMVGEEEVAVLGGVTVA